MHPTVRRTAVLVGALVVLLGMDGLAHREAAIRKAPLPHLDAFEAGLATTVVLVHGDERIRFERAGSEWSITHPFEHPADPAAVGQLVALLASGIRPDARVSDGDHDKYGLDSGDPIRVEVHGANGELAALYVGHDAGGGASFMRFSGEEAVFRARIGGRGRYERAAAEWRDPVLWRLPAGKLVSYEIARDDGQTLGLSLAGDTWSLVGEPDFVVDPTLSHAMASALTVLRATEIMAVAPIGFNHRTGVLTARTADGTTHTAQIEQVGSDLGVAKIDGREGAYRLPGRLAERLLANKEGWADHTLWSMQPVEKLEWISGDERLLVERDPRSNLWIAREPVGVDVDSRAVGAAAGFLARPRVEQFIDLTPEQAGLPGDRSIVVVGGGEVFTLQLGNVVPGAIAGRDAVLVRAPHQPQRVGLMEADVLQRLMFLQ